MGDLLHGKTILILSPQAWGKMFVSKHHYALELARAGNKVFFLGPPEDGLKGSILIEPVEHVPGLSLVRHKLWFPFQLKFHARPLFHALMRIHLNKVVAKLGSPVDIVWSFDLGNYYPFRFFPRKSLKVFHPVDEPLNADALASAQGAQVIFSVTREILEKYAHTGLPRHFINHGVSESFFGHVATARSANDPVRAGFSGNLLRPDIDRATLMKIILENPSVIFECWGSHRADHANIGGSDSDDTIGFIERLSALPNVKLHGPVSTTVLAAELQRMDILLICYDIARDQSGGTNYHKVMEYLSTGKVIVSNNMTTYQDRPGLVEMLPERDSNRGMPALFSKVAGNLGEYNSSERMERRVTFARAHLYTNQLQRISDILEKMA